MHLRRARLGMRASTSAGVHAEWDADARGEVGEVRARGCTSVSVFHEGSSKTSVNERKAVIIWISGLCQSSRMILSMERMILSCRRTSDIVAPSCDDAFAALIKSQDLYSGVLLNLKPYDPGLLKVLHGAASLKNCEAVSGQKAVGTWTRQMS